MRSAREEEKKDLAAGRVEPAIGLAAPAEKDEDEDEDEEEEYEEEAAVRSSDEANADRSRSAPWRPAPTDKRADAEGRPATLLTSSPTQRCSLSKSSSRVACCCCCCCPSCCP
jgi:hypothetical protein